MIVFQPINLEPICSYLIEAEALHKTVNYLLLALFVGTPS